ncbi:hypothetical protein [Absidia glauca]|uniref:Uncharacterized protein n=1 Tax=Absidia glauca TaxID=4829 RepID=A0A168M8Z4_ABSGL|nr:hypothetical protein [Absidia glauca]
MNNTDSKSEYDSSIQHQPTELNLYLPMIGLFAVYTLVYLVRYICWRMKQRRRRIRLLEYEKLRWLWHQQHYKTGIHDDHPALHRKESDEEEICSYFDSSSSSSLSVTTISENEKETKHHDGNCDDSGHSRTPSLVLTIPSPTYHPHDPSPNHHTATHKPHKHHHQCSHTHSSSNVESYYSSSSSTTTLACSCRMNRTLTKEDKKSCTSFLSSPIASPFIRTPTLYYCDRLTNQTNTNKNRRKRDGDDSSYHAFINPTYKKAPSWSFYDTKAKRRNIMWKWSVAMGHCHYDHAKSMSSIIDQLDKPSSH